MVRVLSSRQLSPRRRYQIETTLHEGALAVSGEMSLSGLTLEKMEPILKQAFCELRDWVLYKEGIIGHIKGFVSAPGQALMLSTTGAEIFGGIVEAGDKNQTKMRVSVAAIVFLISQAELEEKLISVFEFINKHQKDYE